MKATTDFTEGKVFSKLIAFALPMALATLLQVLFNTADMVIVGQFSGEKGSIYQAAVGSTSSLVSLIVNLFVGVAIGANVVMANAFGAKDEEKQFKVVHSSVALGLVGGIFILIAGALFSKPMLILMNSPEDVIDYSTTYLTIYFLGAPGLILYNFGAGVLRGVGETRRPLIYLAVSGVVNLVINFITVVFMGLNVVGVALGTAVSQYLSALLVIIYLVKTDTTAKLYLKKIKFHLKETGKILFVGIPMGISSSLFSIANVMIQSYINGYGNSAIAGDSIGKNIETYLDAFASSIEKSVVTIIGQNMGAKKFDRFRLVILSGMVACFAVCAVYGVIVVFFGKYLALVFNSDPVVVEWAYKRMVVMGSAEWFIMIMYSYGGALRGMGYSIVPMIVNVFFTCILRILCLLFLYDLFPTSSVLDMTVELPKIELIYSLYPLTWLLSGLVQMIDYYLCFKREKRKYKEEELLQVA